MALDAARVRFEDGWYEVMARVVFREEPRWEGSGRAGRKAAAQSYMAQVGPMEQAGERLSWFDYYGKYTFTADHDKPEAANHVLQHAIDRLLAVGAAIDQAINAQFTDTLPPSHDPAC